MHEEMEILRVKVRLASSLLLFKIDVKNTESAFVVFVVFPSPYVMLKSLPFKLMIPFFKQRCGIQRMGKCINNKIND